MCQQQEQQRTKSIKKKSNQPMTKLTPDFKPSDLDVICCRGKSAYEHNVHFRDVVQQYLSNYADASTKAEKSKIVSAIVKEIRTGSPLGGFVRKINGDWYIVNDAIAREKIGGCFREMLADMYKSSSKSKKRRRQEEEGSESETETDEEEIQTDRISSQMISFIAPISEIIVIPPKKQRRMERPVSTSKNYNDGDDVVLPPLTPSLPPPIKFPTKPTSMDVFRGCSFESVKSFDFDPQEGLDLNFLTRLSSLEAIQAVWETV